MSFENPNFNQSVQESEKISQDLSDEESKKSESLFVKMTGGLHLKPMGSYPIKVERVEGFDPHDKRKRLPPDIPDLDKPLYDINPLPKDHPMSPTGHSGGLERISNKNRFALNTLGFSTAEIVALNNNQNFADTYLDNFVNDRGAINPDVDSTQLAETIRKSFSISV
jgi:hypothetical protein